MNTFVAILLFFFGLGEIVAGVKEAQTGKNPALALAAYVFAGLAIWAGVWVTAL